MDALEGERRELPAMTREAIEWLKDKGHALVALFAFAICVHGCTTAPEWMFDRASRLLDRVLEDPQGVASAIAIVGGALALAATGFLAAWRRDPNTSGVSSSPRPTRTPPGPRAGFATLDTLLLVLACAGVLLASLSLHGCGQTTPVAQQAAAVDVAAITTGAVASIVHEAADADARSTCPEGSDPSCLDPVAERWAPVDASIGAVRAALGAWLAADRIAAAANGDPVAEAFDEIGAFVSAYDALRAALAFTQRVDLPRLPAVVCAVAGVPLEECSPTSGGAS